MHRAGGVGDGTLGMLAGGFYRFDGNAQVAHVIHGIKDAENVDTIGGRFGDEGANDVIAVMAIAEQVLATQQHLQTGIR